MKYLITCILFLLSYVATAQPLTDSVKAVIRQEYLERRSRDQMKHLPQYYDIKAKNRTDSLEMLRQSYFRENFAYLVSITKLYGFPDVSKLLVEGDTLFNEWRTFPSITLIHIMQTYPKLMLTDEVVQLFAKELENGNMPKSMIETALIFYTKFSEPCIEDKEQVMKALKAWKLPPVEDKYFTKCK